MITEVLIIQRPTKTESEDGKLEKIIFGPKLVISSNEQSAMVSATVQAAAELSAVEDKSRIEILVRPF